MATLITSGVIVSSIRGRYVREKRSLSFICSTVCGLAVQRGVVKPRARNTHKRRSDLE